MDNLEIANTIIVFFIMSIVILTFEHPIRKNKGIKTKGKIIDIEKDVLRRYPKIHIKIEYTNIYDKKVIGFCTIDKLYYKDFKDRIGEVIDIAYFEEDMENVSIMELENNYISGTLLLITIIVIFYLGSNA